MTYNNLGNSKIDTAWAQNVSGLMRNSFTAKVIMIGIVVLLCQIPILMVDDYKITISSIISGLSYDTSVCSHDLVSFRNT